MNDQLKTKEAELNEKQDELNYVKMNLKTSVDKEHMYEQMVRLRDDKIESLISRVKELELESGRLRVESEQYRQSAEMLDRQAKAAGESYEKLIGEMNQLRVSVDTSLKGENEKLRVELKQRTETANRQSVEFDQVLAKLNSQVDYAAEQEKLIRQLRQVQSELQQAVRAQQATQQTLETENRELRRNYDEIAAKFERCVTDERRLGAELETVKSTADVQLQQLRANHTANIDLIKAQKFEIDKLRLQIDLQTEQLDSKQILCDELSKKLHFLEAQFRNVKHFN